VAKESLQIIEQRASKINIGSGQLLPVIALVYSINTHTPHTCLNYLTPKLTNMYTDSYIRGVA